jgi:hypothetical protein
MPTLTPEQKKIIKEIEKQAIAYGVDPDFAIALANLESNFQNIPAGDKSSTAFGPFQVNKATAEANGYDYEKMKSNPTIAIQAGISNLARHAKNPLFEGDPLRIAAAHRYGEGSDYAKTGNTKLIDQTLREYLASAMEHFPDERFPETVYSDPRNVEKTGKAEAPDTSMGSIALGGENAKEVQDALNEQDAFDRQVAAAQLGGAGALFGAVKAPVFSAGQKLFEMVRNYKNGKIDPSDVEALIDAQNLAKQTSAVSPTTQEPTGPYAKYTKTFGDPVGLTQQEIATSTGMGKGEGEAWDKIKKAKEANQKITNLFGEGYKLDPERQIMLDTSAGSGPRGAPKQPLPPTKIALPPEQQAKYLMDYDNWLKAQVAARTAKDSAPNAIKTIAGSSPVRFGLAGAGAGFNLADAYQKLSQEGALNTASGLTSLGAAGTSVLGAVPKYAARANPAAIGLTTASQVMGDLARGDRQAAAESGLTGATALAPRIFGAPAAALYSRGLNVGEAEELKRRRKMAPTITAP